MRTERTLFVYKTLRHRCLPDCIASTDMCKRGMNRAASCSGSFQLPGQHPCQILNILMGMAGEVSKPHSLMVSAFRFGTVRYEFMPEVGRADQARNCRDSRAVHSPSFSSLRVRSLIPNNNYTLHTPNYLSISDRRLLHPLPHHVQHSSQLVYINRW